MSYTQISVERSGGIAWISLNRPEAMNAITLEMINELKDAMTALGKDKEVGVIVLTGAGKAFCAGMDLKALGSAKFENGAIGDSYDLPMRACIAEMRSIPKPVIGMINGACITGAMELAVNCDILIASEKAKFGDTHCRWGLRPSWGLSAKFPRLVGIMKAKELTFTGRIFSAQEAEKYGIVNRVVAPENLKSEVKALADAILKNSAEAVAAGKYLYNKGMATTQEEAMKIEFTTTFPIHDTHDRLKEFLK